MRDLEEAASQGNEQAQLALDVFVTEIRRHLGGLLVELGGLDALVFTGGIGENSALIRKGVCAGLAGLGIALDESANLDASGECSIGGSEGSAQVWIVPTNEELIVARQTQQLLEG